MCGDCRRLLSHTFIVVRAKLVAASNTEKRVFRARNATGRASDGNGVGYGVRGSRGFSWLVVGCVSVAEFCRSMYWVADMESVV